MGSRGWMIRKVFSQTVMTRFAIVFPLTAALAIYAGVAADIQPRELDLPRAIRLELADGTALPCTVRRWDGVGLQGSCGLVGWERIKAGPALNALRSIVSDRDSEGCSDAAAVVVSLEPSGPAARTALEWARKAGADAARLERVRRDASDLSVARAERARLEASQRLARLTPEAGVFAPGPWGLLTPEESAIVASTMLEEARALLSRAGGSATLHQTAHISFLAESGDAERLKDAARLEGFYRVWVARFESARIVVAEQGAIPVIFVADRDRWRLLLAVAFEGEAAQHRDAVTIYPPTGEPPTRRPIALITPDSDPSRAQYNQCVGVARAMLHLAGTAERGPAWMNEGLPRVMATLQVPAAGMDLVLRERGLVAVRGGSGFGAVLSAPYSDAIWRDDSALAYSLSYMFVRWLEENAPVQLLRYAKSSKQAESESARFQRCFAMTLDEAAAKATKWFQTND